jgi:hypothetical protein
MTSPRTERRTRAAKQAVYARATEGIAQGLDLPSVCGWALACYGRTLSWRVITDLLTDAGRDALAQGIDRTKLDPSWLPPPPASVALVPRQSVALALYDGEIEALFRKVENDDEGGEAEWPGK